MRVLAITFMVTVVLMLAAIGVVLQETGVWWWWVAQATLSAVIIPIAADATGILD